MDWDRIPPESERGLLGKQRPFLRGFLLAAATLGLYSLWWHYRTHAELTRFLGRPNRLKYVWGGHILLFAVIIGFVLFVVLPAAMDHEEKHGEFPLAVTEDSGEPYELMAPVPERAITQSGFMAFLKHADLFVPAVILFLLFEAFYAIHVIFQHRLLFRHTDRFEGWRASAIFFLGLVWGSAFLTQVETFSVMSTLILFAITLGMLLLAYYNLQSTYNDFWQDVEPRPAVAPGHLRDDLPDGRGLV